MRVTIVENASRRFGSAATYCRLLVLSEEGQFETLLLTEHDLQAARLRTQKNPEDAIAPGGLLRLSRWILRLLF